MHIPIVMKKNFSPQEYLPDQIAGTKFYDPGKNAREEELRKFLKGLDLIKGIGEVGSYPYMAFRGVKHILCWNAFDEKLVP